MFRFKQTICKGHYEICTTHLTHSMYKETVLSGTALRSTNTRIATNYHKLFTVVVNKISLSPFDKNQYIGADKICSLPFGHWSLRDEMFAREILQNPDWGESDQEESSLLKGRNKSHF